MNMGSRWERAGTTEGKRMDSGKLNKLRTRNLKNKRTRKYSMEKQEQDNKTNKTKQHNLKTIPQLKSFEWCCILIKKTKYTYRQTEIIIVMYLHLCFLEHWCASFFVSSLSTHFLPAKFTSVHAFPPLLPVLCLRFPKTCNDRQKYAKLFWISLQRTDLKK